MTLFGGRVLLFILFPLALFGFLLGVFHFNTDKVRCFEHKHWTSTRWYTFMSIGDFELRYRDFNWTCDTKYDPKEYRKNNIQYVQ